MTIRVLIVDDHEFVRMGIQQYLTNVDGFEVVAAVADGAAAVEAAAVYQPDVVLMDLAMPVMDGVEATRRVLEASAGTNVLVLTSFSDRERIIDAIDAGATGYLLKDSEPEDLVRGIQAAARGESLLSPKAAQAIIAARRERAPVSELTTRETEVLVLIARGLANKEIARKLGISEKTVKSHLTNIFQRIGVADRTQAALWAERTGLLAASERPHPGR